MTWLISSRKDILAFSSASVTAQLVRAWTGTFLRGHYYIYGYDCDDVTDESRIVAEIPDDGNIYNVYVLEKTVLFIALIY